MFTGPQVIDTVAANANGSFWYVRPTFFNVGTARFFFIQKATGATWQLKTYKLIAGLWTEVAIGTGPLCMKPGGVAGLQTTTSCPTYIVDPLDASKIIAAYVEPTASNLSIASFDTVGLAWTVISTAGPVVHGVDLVFIATVFSDDTGSKAGIGYRPSDNKFVFNFQGAPEVVVNNCLRPNFVTFDRAGVVWSAPVIIAVAGENLPYVSYGIVVDPVTSISYAAIVKPNGGTAATTFEIYYVQINADNTINPKVQVAVDVRKSREPNASYPVLQKFGGQTIFNIAYNDNFATGFVKARVGRAVVGVAPVFVIEDISTNADNAPLVHGFETVGIAVGDNGKLYAFWIGEPTPNFPDTLFMSKTSGIGSGWDVPSVAFQSNFNTDFLDFNTVSSLPGINPGGATIAIGNLDSHIAAVSGTDSSFYYEFSEAGPAAAFAGPLKLNTPQPVNLPDPRVLCDRGQQKRCIVFQGEELMYQGSKGIFYVVRQ
jgi:hypothetical protein